eukprot:scaffold635_cov535-Prasinococcus_capsulatus_cf.AAC.6
MVFCGLAQWAGRAGAVHGPSGGSMYTVAGVHTAMICSNVTTSYGRVRVSVSPCLYSQLSWAEC